MIDFHDGNQVLRISYELLSCAKQYSKSRQLAAEKKHSLDILLAASLPELRKKKNNLGHETALIMLLEGSSDEIKAIYKEYITQEATYKGLEKVIDALQSQISLIQSLIKNNKEKT